MQGDNKNTKVKILLFLVFGLITVVFLTEIVRLIVGGFETIDREKRDLNCNSLDLEVNPLSYRNNNLMLEVISNDYDTNITRIIISSDSSSTEYELPLEEAVRGGYSGIFTVNNISIAKMFYFEANDCGTKHEITIEDQNED